MMYNVRDNESAGNLCVGSRDTGKKLNQKEVQEQEKGQQQKQGQEQDQDQVEEQKQE